MRVLAYRGLVVGARNAAEVTAARRLRAAALCHAFANRPAALPPIVNDAKVLPDSDIGHAVASALSLARLPAGCEEALLVRLVSEQHTSMPAP